MRGYKGCVIILNIITTIFFAIIDESEDWKFQKVKNSINILLIEINKRIQIRVKDFIIFIYIIHFLIDIRFKCVDFNSLIIIALFECLIFKEYDIATMTNLIYETQIMSFRFFIIKITRNVMLLKR